MAGSTAITRNKVNRTLQLGVFSVKMRFWPFLLAFLLVGSVFVAAQSPNTSSMIVLVTDQTGTAVTDATVSVTNTETGAVRDVHSGNDGSATVGALSLTGT